MRVWAAKQTQKWLTEGLPRGSQSTRDRLLVTLTIDEDSTHPTAGGTKKPAQTLRTSVDALPPPERAPHAAYLSIRQVGQMVGLTWKP